MKKAVISLVLILAILLLSIYTTFAWFASCVSFTPDLPASAIIGYFARGDGLTPETAFVINRPEHLYNLAWLQYLGLLNVKDENGMISQYYFEIDEALEGDLDMSDIILPPIGTTEFPFVGHFDGNGKCISNLTVSNHLSASADDEGITLRPFSVTTINETTVSVVGFFGVVGAMNKDMQKMLVDDSDADTLMETRNAVHDLFLKNLTIRTETDNSLIGLFAGYVNGSIGNIGIGGESSLELGENVKPLTAKQGLEMQLIISAYSLIGKYDKDNVFWVGGPTSGWTGSNNNDGVGWGGSIDMFQLRQRITHIVGAVGVTFQKRQAYTVNSNLFTYNGIFSANQQYIISGNSPTSSKVSASLLDGTVLPLSIDISKLGAETKGLDGTFDTREWYTKNSTEPVAKTNSGYIVGGGSKDTAQSNVGNSYIDYRVDYVCGTIARNIINGVGIYKSIHTEISSSILLPANNIHLLTIAANGTTYAISDNENKSANTLIASKYSGQMIAYNDPKLNFQKYSIIENGTDIGVKASFFNQHIGSQYLQGIKFNSAIPTPPPPNANGKSPIDSSAILTAKNVSLFGNTYDNYEMIKGAINFTVKSSGVVTAIAGTYAAHGTANLNPDVDSNNNPINHQLFSIFQIERGSDNKIVSYQLIKTIHKTPAGEYVYNKTNPETGDILVYHSEEMSTLTEVGAAYYFEIPLPAGDYAIGALENSSESTYGVPLLYLDIGSNGDMAETTTPGQQMHSMSGITFVDEAAIQNQSTDGYSVIAFEVALKEGVTSHKGLDVSYSRPTKGSMYYDYVIDQSDSSDTFKITPAKDPNDTTSISKGIVSQSLMYYKKRNDFL